MIPLRSLAIKMTIYEESQPERTMSLMIDYPVPIKNTDYAYYVGELLPFNIAIFLWMNIQNRYITSYSNISQMHDQISIKRKMSKIIQKRISLNFHNIERTDDELKEQLITILDQ